MITELTPVKSSNCSAMGHDPVTQTMTVLFHTGTRYSYQNVSTATYEQILNAPSVGSAFNKLVKSQPAAHPFTQEA